MGISVDQQEVVAYANRPGLIAGGWVDLDVWYRGGTLYLHVVLGG